MNEAKAIEKKKEKPKCPHKKTDFRYELWVKERKSLNQKAKKNSFRVEMCKGRKGAVTVDTTKTRSNIDVLRLCLRDLHWIECPYGKREGICDIYWHSVNFNDNLDLQGGRVNKFPGMIETVRKVNLSRTLDILKTLFPEDFDFHPNSWLLPQQLAEFNKGATAMAEKSYKPVYIVKPDEGSQGEGIYLISDPKDYVVSVKSHVVQEYIAKPLLIDKLKFDLRLYVVLLSLDPLEIYLGREGLARFCTVPYEAPTVKNLHESFMHLTNYSLNKKSGTFVHTEAEDSGSKQTMSCVFTKLESLGYDMNKTWHLIKQMVIKTIIAMSPELKIMHRGDLPPGRGGPKCFQILGFDVLLTHDCRPVLLEVNANPSLRIDYEQEVAAGISEYVHSPVDEIIKKPLVHDALLLTAPKNKLSSRQLRQLHRKYTSNHDVVIEITEEEDKKENEESDLESSESSSKFYTFDENEGALEKIYPSKDAEDLKYLFLLERIAEIFVFCLGVRGSLRMGPTGFRTFTRKCCLSGKNFTNAQVDIMFIDLHKKWDYMNTPAVPASGICFQAFLEAFHVIAKKKTPDLPLLAALQTLLIHCEDRLGFDHSIDRRFGSMLPKIPLTKIDTRQEEMKAIYGSSNLYKRMETGSTYYIDYRDFPTGTKRQVKKKTSLNKSVKKISIDGIPDPSPSTSGTSQGSSCS